MALTPVTDGTDYGADIDAILNAAFTSARGRSRAFWLRVVWAFLDQVGKWPATKRQDEIAFKAIEACMAEEPGTGARSVCGPNMLARLDAMSTEQLRALIDRRDTVGGLARAIEIEAAEETLRTRVGRCAADCGPDCPECGEREGAQMSAPKEYLGDGVYVRDDGGGLVLTTENGIRATNTIYLEPEVWAALASYVERARSGRSRANAMPAGCSVCGANPRTHACDEEACEPTTGAEGA